MKNAPLQTEEMSAATGALYRCLPTTLSPCQRRLLQVLFLNNVTCRHDLDALIGAENSPDVVQQLRRKCAMNIPMTKRKFINRDGKATYLGYYSLSITDLIRISMLLNSYPNGKA